MRRTTRIWMPVVLAIVATTVIALPATAGSDEPVRSGTIVGGTAATTQLWGIADKLLDGCEATPECLTWVRTGCRRALTGRDVAVTTSIEDVAGLRGTQRFFEFGGGSPGGLAWGGVDVQFWRRDCTEIRRGRWASWHSWDGDGWWHGTELRVPTAAKWMTVTGSQDTVNIRWTLT